MVSIFYISFLNVLLILNLVYILLDIYLLSDLNQNLFARFAYYLLLESRIKCKEENLKICVSYTS